MRLKDAKRLAVLGIGSVLQGDDEAGLELARRLSRERRLSRRVRAIEAGMAPENFISAIRRFNPSQILVIDAADMGLPPGSIRIVDRGEIAGLPISTHGLPLSFLIEYLEKELGVGILVVGIQPLRVGPGEGISKPVKESLDLLERILSSLFAQKSRDEEAEAA
ncbi:MAG: hydrogenase maturation peptidase HycI [Promethearchaeati archaeon SRVP18_Atabeyarchaeia-1]